MSIKLAIALIAQFDPAAARLFATRPFHRHTLVTAIHKSLSQSSLSHLADEISVQLRAAIDAEKGVQ